MYRRYKMMTMVLGKRIQEEREKRGLTQDQLAQMLNVSRQAISKWELGTAYPISAQPPGIVTWGGSNGNITNATYTFSTPAEITALFG